MKARLRWLVLAYAGCLRSSLVPCGDLLCPAGSQCIDDVVCARDEQLGLCGPTDDGVECRSPLGTGHCFHGVCIENVCGDGLRTGNEVCDGDDVGVSCADLGFYQGTPTCTMGCSIESRGCSESCGDGIVQELAGEQCDGAPPSEGCVSFGRDYGLIACNSFCAPAITRDCHHYGWTQLLAPSEFRITSAQANARGAIAITQSEVQLRWDNLVSARTNVGYSAAAANTTTLAVAGTSGILWFDGTWHEAVIPMQPPSRAYLTEAMVLYTLTDCTVRRIDLASTPPSVTAIFTVPGATTCTDIVALADDRVFVAAGTAGLQWWNGTDWSQLSGTLTSVVQLRGPNELLAFGNYQPRVAFDLSALPFAKTTERTHGPFDAIAADVDGNVVDAEFDDDQSEAFLGHTRVLVEPEVGDMLVRSAHGRLLVAGDDGLRQLDPIQLFANLMPSTITSMRHTDNGLLLCGDIVARSTDLGVTSLSLGGQGVCQAITGDAAGTHLFASSSGIYRFDPPSTYTSERGGFTSTIAGDMTEAWAFSIELVRRDSTGVWTPMPTPFGCSNFQIVATPARAFYAVATCGFERHVFALNGTTWSAIHEFPLYSARLRVAHDGTVFAIHMGGVYRLEASGFVDLGHTDVQDLQAISATEYYAHVGDGVYVHERAGMRSEVRLPVGPFAVSATHLYVVDNVLHRLYAVTRMPSIPNTGL